MPFFEYEEPVNEGERQVARRLRDEFEAEDAEWFVISNVEFPDSDDRWWECDAIALSSSGYGYLIEVKYWAGPIRGNDSTWLMPNQRKQLLDSDYPLAGPSEKEQDNYHCWWPALMK